MPEKKELSQQEIEEIQSLRGKISPSEARKRFGIGTSRLYRIWKSAAEKKVEENTELQKEKVEKATADSPTTVEDIANIATNLSVSVANMHKLLQNTAVRIESMQKENGEALLEILSLLDTEEEDNVVDKIEEEVVDNVEEAKKETISAVERVGKTIGMYKMYACALEYIPVLLGFSFAVYHTWKHCKKTTEWTNGKSNVLPKLENTVQTRFSRNTLDME